MKDIICIASRDAYKIRDADISTSELKGIAHKNANSMYPRGTRLQRGIYKHAFIRKFRYYEHQLWVEEINSYR